MGDNNTGASRAKGGSQEVSLVQQWKGRFDQETYDALDNLNREMMGRDIVGWVSMYDGQDIPKAEMNEWLDDTIKTLLNGRSPGDILEIGTGSGMILFNLSDNIQSYIGLEPSGRAVDFISQAVRPIACLKDKIQIFKGAAADVGRLKGPLSSKLVVINSVIQYFPSQNYLFEVIQDLLKLPNIERIFCGDIRSFALYDDFLARGASHIAVENTSQEEMRQIINDMKQAESELLLDPSFFTSLQSRIPDRIHHIEILPKIMEATKELSCYRYAAIIHVMSTHQQAARLVHDIGQDEWIDFTSQCLDSQSLLRLLSDHHDPDASLAISNITNSKTIVDR